MKIYLTKSPLLTAVLLVVISGSANAQSAAASTESANPVNASAVSQPVNKAISTADQVALAQKFQYSKKCLETSIQAEQLLNAFNVCQKQLIGSPERNKCDLKTKGADTKSRALTGSATVAGCPADADVASRDFSISLVNAARAGVADAQLCYFEWSGPLSAPGDIARYKREASLYMQKGLENGDWRVVQLLATSPQGVEGNGAGLMSNLDIIGKWFTAFRANRLLELGATGPYKTELHRTAQDAAHHLTKAQIENGNAWANHEFRTHFSNSPVLTKAPDTCLNLTGDVAG